mgnify:CR=1 FL=1
MEEKKRVPCEVYSRIVGYFRPVRNWNKGKRQEFIERKVYKMPREESEETAVHVDQRAG